MNALGFSANGCVIGGSFKFKTFTQIRQAVIDEFNGDNLQALADKYGYRLLDVHKIIFSARPDDYAQALANQRRASATNPKNCGGWQNTSASPGRARNRHRKSQQGGNYRHSGNSRNAHRSDHSCRTSASKLPEQQTVCNVHISIDRPGRVYLSATLASGQALELTFSPDGRNAGKRRSCRA